MNQSGDLNRTCYVEINNSCGFYQLTDPRIWMASGQCEVSPPQIEKRSKASCAFDSFLGTATGSAGVFTYNLRHSTRGEWNAVLAIMFSVPFDYNLYSNWCGVGIFYRGMVCDQELFDLIYYGTELSFIRVKGGTSSRSYEGEVVEVSAVMTDSSRAVLKVDIVDISDGHVRRECCSANQ